MKSGYYHNNHRVLPALHLMNGGSKGAFQLFELRAGIFNRDTLKIHLNNVLPFGNLCYPADIAVIYTFIVVIGYLHYLIPFTEQSFAHLYLFIAVYFGVGNFLQHGIKLVHRSCRFGFKRRNDLNSVRVLTAG